MSELFVTLLGFFQDLGWNIQQHDELPIVRFEYVGDNGEWTCYARVREDANQLIFLSVLNENVPESRRLAIAELITRINFGLNIGNFEMDFEDGELRYKTSIDVTNSQLTTPLIDRLMMANLIAMDDHLLGIQKVIANQGTPSQVIAEIQQSLQEEDEEFDLVT